MSKFVITNLADGKFIGEEGFILVDDLDEAEVFESAEEASEKCEMLQGVYDRDFANLANRPAYLAPLPDKFKGAVAPVVLRLANDRDFELFTIEAKAIEASGGTIEAKAIEASGGTIEAKAIEATEGGIPKSADSFLSKFFRGKTGG